MKLKSLEFDFIWYVSKTFRQNENIDAKFKKLEIIEKISNFSNFVKFFSGKNSMAKLSNSKWKSVCDEI